MNTDGSYQESRWLDSKYWFDFSIYWLQVKKKKKKSDLLTGAYLLSNLGFCFMDSPAADYIEPLTVCWFLWHARQLKSIVHLCES